jgi:hypothetical protein
VEYLFALSGLLVAAMLLYLVVYLPLKHDRIRAAAGERAETTGTLEILRWDENSGEPWPAPISPRAVDHLQHPPTTVAEIVTYPHPLPGDRPRPVARIPDHLEREQYTPRHAPESVREVHLLDYCAYNRRRLRPAWQELTGEVPVAAIGRAPRPAVALPELTQAVVR